jgi:uncharacterized protein (TIGR00299 family) protein
MPVPAPATLELLKGVPLRNANIPFELTTPTGAAILTSVVREYADSPRMIVETVGIGTGSKDLLEQPNILRLLVGLEIKPRPAGPRMDDIVTVLETNLDDCPGEVISYAIDRLFAAGALDVFTIPIQMKKNRPGVLLTVIANAQTVEECERILFQETATFGIRRRTMPRNILQREVIEVETPWGKVKAKRGRRDGIEVVSPEYEECVRVAREQGVALSEVYRAVRR